MAGRRRKLSSSSSPRYKAKMYDYMSRGGRIPMVLTMEVVDAMAADWDKNFGDYHNDAEKKLVPEMSKLGMPNILQGITRALFYGIKKEVDIKGAKTTAAIEEIINRVITEQGLQGTVVEKALKRAFGVEMPTPSEEGGEEESISVSPPKT